MVYTDAAPPKTVPHLRPWDDLPDSLPLHVPWVFFRAIAFDPPSRDENYKTMNQTIKFAKELDTDYAQFLATVPYPGTRLFEEIKKGGEFLIQNWEEFGTFEGKTYFELGDIKEGLVEKMHKKAYRSFYLRPKYILKKICESRFPKHTLKKKKQGFGIPIEKWLRQNHGRYLKELLLDQKTINRGYFKSPSIEKSLNVFINNLGDYYFPSSTGIVGLLTLELWFRRYID